MLMRIKHYYFEPLEEATATLELLINTQQILRVTQADATEHLPAGCRVEYLDISDRVIYRLDLTLENFYAAYWALWTTGAPQAPTK
jgi:hypothetical protein